jgi:hypothetical protein
MTAIVNNAAYYRLGYVRLEKRGELGTEGKIWNDLRAGGKKAGRSQFYFNIISMANFRTSPSLSMFWAHFLKLFLSVIDGFL